MPTDKEYQAALKAAGMTDDPDYEGDDEGAEGEAPAKKRKAKKKRPSSTIGGFLDQVAQRHKMLHDM